MVGLTLRGEEKTHQIFEKIFSGKAENYPLRIQKKRRVNVSNKPLRRPSSSKINKWNCIKTAKGRAAGVKKFGTDFNGVNICANILELLPAFEGRALNGIEQSQVYSIIADSFESVSSELELFEIYRITKDIRTQLSEKHRRALYRKKKAFQEILLYKSREEKIESLSEELLQTREQLKEKSLQLNQVQSGFEQESKPSEPREEESGLLEEIQLQSEEITRLKKSLALVESALKSKNEKIKELENLLRQIVSLSLSPILSAEFPHS